MCLLNSSLLTYIAVCRLHYQSAVTSSQSVCQINPVGGKIALSPVGGKIALSHFARDI